MVTCSPESEVPVPPLLAHSDFSQRASGILSSSKSVDGLLSETGTPPTAHPLLLTFSTREQALETFSKGLITNSLRLFVAVSGLFVKEDHESLCGFLCQGCLTQAPCEIQTLVCSMSLFEFALSSSDLLTPHRPHF